MTSNCARTPLATKLLQYMSRHPDRGYVANNLTKLFKVSAENITSALEELLCQGEVVTASLPPKSLAYFVRPKGMAAPQRPVWRELRRWEAGLGERQALCEMTRRQAGGRRHARA